jgi:hypothetical protein
VRFSVQVIRRGSALGQPSSLLPPQQSSSVSQAKRHWFKSPVMNPPPLPPLPVVEAPELPPEPEEVELEPSLVLGFPEALLFVDAVAPLPPEPEAFAVLVLLAAELASSPSASVVLLPQATSEASAQADPRIQVFKEVIQLSLVARPADDVLAFVGHGASRNQPLARWRTIVHSFSCAVPLLITSPALRPRAERECPWMTDRNCRRDESAESSGAFFHPAS